MNKQFAKKLSAAALAVVMAAPAISLMQDSLLSDLASYVNKNADIAYATGNPASIVTNTASVSSPTLDTTSSNDTATAQDYFCYSSDIEVTSFTDGVTSTQASSAHTYTAVVTNNGDSQVTEFTIDFTFNTVFLDDTNLSESVSTGSIAGPSTSTSGDDQINTYTVSGITLLPTQSVTITFSGLEVRADAVDGTTYTASVDIDPTQPSFDECAIVDPTPANNTASDTTDMVRVADLALVKTSSGGADSSNSTIGTLYAGSTMSYTLAVSNNGPSEAAANIVVTDTWPSQIVPTDQGGGNYTASAGWTCAYSAPTMTCTNTSAMANGGSSNIVIAGTVNQTY